MSAWSWEWVWTEAGAAWIVASIGWITAISLTIHRVVLARRQHKIVCHCTRITKLVDVQQEVQDRTSFTLDGKPVQDPYVAEVLVYNTGEDTLKDVDLLLGFVRDPDKFLTYGYAPDTRIVTERDSVNWIADHGGPVEIALHLQYLNSYRRHHDGLRFSLFYDGAIQYKDFSARGMGENWSVIKRTASPASRVQVASVMLALGLAVGATLGEAFINGALASFIAVGVLCLLAAGFLGVWQVLSGKTGGRWGIPDIGETRK
jgi:hypothetical protein